MDVVSTILACSLYLGDDELVRAIAESTSESNPFFVVDRALDLTQVDPPPPPKTMPEALARLETIRAQGGRPVLGLLQLAPTWLATFGREVREAFDPCVNIAVGTAMLAAFDAECTAMSFPAQASSPARSATRRRACILHKYQEAIGERDFVTVTLLELHAQRSLPALVNDAPIFAPVESRPTGLDPILATVVFRPTASP